MLSKVQRCSHGASVSVAIGKATWSMADQPLERRVPETFLFSLKKQLVAWDFSRQQIRVCTDRLTLEVDGTCVVSACVKDKSLILDWDPAWLAWSDFSQSAELAALKTRAADVLARSTASKGKKGKSKGSE